ncbi:hypothetical protein AJ80_09924 [Polytolypa hystricis UAMH7299]|uniref:Sulfatase N-terminal domain-containing protein n=1 Tax=Polytolypa hystricis (strain UAMH7299) TaxID=1447883 RepID=A0A2B7WGE5_POLH7|nr:hypothetical protein AJ80_09924 [Polytolypa hystricis UAMH7299]
MNTPSFRLSRPFVFSVVVVAPLASKFLHLFQHVGSIPSLRFILFFPTFFIQDCFLVIVARLLLHGSTGTLPLIGLCIASFLSVVLLFAAAAQIGFYYVTGGEIQWDATSNVAGDPAAVRLMMSGIGPVSIAGLFLLLLSVLVTPVLFNKVGGWLLSVYKLVSPASWDTLLPLVQKSDSSHKRVFRLWPLCMFTTILALTVLQLTRPSTPYDHMSLTLPFAMTKIFYTKKIDECAMQTLPNGQSFPLPDLVKEEFWEVPRDSYKGWAPGQKSFFARQYAEWRPGWLPEKVPAGFFRWDPDTPITWDKNFKNNSTAGGKKDKCSSDGKPTHYNPVADPLRITNLDLEPYEALQEALQDPSVIISHVVLVTLESARKDLFPIKEGSYLYNQIIKSHGEKKTKAEINKDLAKLTTVAEQITGENFQSQPTNHSQKRSPSDGVWQDNAGPGMGGINVIGGLTGSSLSFKSVLGSHCGVGPLPEDFLEEVNGDIYQPCIPQILNLFNHGKEDAEKDDEEHRDSVLKRKWRSVFAQSITDHYDRQDVLNEHMSFDETIVRDNLDDKESKYYPPSEPELNYFGYSEHQIKPYIRDLIADAVEKKQRLFLSHMTSTTHHPWKVPEEFNSTEYMGSEGSHEHLNSYLNAVRFDDIWLGELLGLLDDAGISNETLVVVVGDHGQAFEEDSEKTGTYENSHISNFRVPLLFRHPHLPRVQVHANATSMSIIPTILDLLINTNSLDKSDKAAASDLIHEYEAQSLLRPYKPQHNGRQAWNFGIINAGGSLLAITSAAVPYRLVIPLSKDYQFRFTNLEKDPNELHPSEEWTLDDMFARVSRYHGEAAAKWVAEADAIGRWWAKERHRLYHYHGKK